MAPWAFAGLVAVAAPVLVHWLARQQADRLAFPTLRFLVRTPPVSVRRHRLRDLPLLFVRVLIVVAAVAALAQPVWVRPAAPAARPARAIVVDTSASLRRALADGRVGRDVAREAAAAFAANVSGGEPPAMVIPAERLAGGVAQAAAWLAREEAPRELIVVSDFQTGALVASDLDAVPPDAGVRLVPVPVSGPVPAEPAPARGRLRVVAGAPGSEEARRAAAAEAAARTTIEAPKKTSGVFLEEKDTRRLFEVALVSQDTSIWQAVRASSQPIDTTGLFAWVSDIRRELDRAGWRKEKTSGVFFAKKTPDVFSETGLAVFTNADPGSLEAATLMAAILRVVGPTALTPAEREPDTLAPATLQAWQREPAPRPAPGRNSGRSDGRWLWALALALLALETWMRRSPRAAKSEVAHADAA
ncbi:MAG: hypothetical protein EXQ49_08145 [Acidobacteria bacterium]|nr:hypothetical protein [Acidobacteriota bacterium]